MKSVMIIDHDSVVENMHKQGLRPTPTSLASRLRRSAKLIDPSTHMIVYGKWYEYQAEVDSDGAILPSALVAFESEGFEVRGTFGSRDETLHAINGLILDKCLPENGCEQLIVVSDDEGLIPNLQRVHRFRKRLIVRVWGSDLAAPELRQQHFNFVSLQEQLDLKIKKGSLIIDCENMISGIVKKGYSLDIKSLIEIINSYADDHGHIIDRRAYADFGALGRANGLDGTDLQRSLEMNGISTRFVPSTPGKNSSDMVIASDLKTLAGQPNPPDFVIIVSSDRDFKMAISTLRQRRCEVILLAIRGAISLEMVKMDDVKVDFLDDLIPDDLHQGGNGGTNSTGLSPEVRMIVILYGFMSKRGWNWITMENAVSALSETKGFGFPNAEAKVLLKDAQVNEILSMTEESNGKKKISALRFNRRHQIVNTSLKIIEVLRSRMSHAHTVKGYPSVRGSYIAYGLGVDTRLTQHGIIISDRARHAWIRLSTECNILSIENDADGKYASVNRQMYKLVDQFSSVISEGIGDLDAMIRRLITKADLFTQISGVSWAPLKMLDRELTPYGRPTYFEAVEYLVDEGAAHVGTFENNRPNGNPVTGITFIENSKIVVRARNERLALIKKFWDLQESGHEISIAILKKESVLEFELSERRIRLWFDILNCEHVLKRYHGNEATFRLNANHQFVKEFNTSETTQEKQQGHNGEFTKHRDSHFPKLDTHAA